MTGDLYASSQLEHKVKVGTEEFLKIVGNRLAANVGVIGGE